jgi:putative ABC transport system permease protein
MMTWMHRVVGGLRALFTTSRVDLDLDEELVAYFDAAVERHMQAGMSLDAATRAARIEMGSTTAVKQHVREAGWESRLEDLWQDARYGMRTLRKSRGFTAVAVLSLALAIGANTAMFSIVNGLMLRALPVTAPEQLALVSTSSAVRDGFPGGWNMSMWEQIRQRSSSLGRALAWTVLSQRFDLATEGEANPVDGLFVSGNFFQELGVVPVIGRAFTTTEDNLGRVESRVAVISYGLWQRRFGGDADIVGRSMLVNRVPVTVVGVAPPAFLGPEVGRAFDIALPIGSAPLILHDASWGGPVGRSYLAVMLRLAPGQSLESAGAALRGMQRQMIEATLPPNGIWGENQDSQLKDPFAVVPAAAGTSDLRRQYSRAVVTILIIAALVLLIACANIASLMMARGAARSRELSLRLALGAPRRRLIQQLLIESLILASMGAAIGLAVATWASGAVVTQMSTWFDRVTLDVTLDWRVVSFTVLVTIATALLFGLTPAFRASSLTPVVAPKNPLSSGGNAMPRFWSRGGLVAAQVSMSLLLVITAGLFIRTFDRLLAVPLGFESSGVLVVEVDASRTASAPGARTALYERLASVVAELPAVAEAGASLNTPANHGLTLAGDYIAPGMPELPTMERRAIVNFVTPGWFRTYGLSVRAGRVVNADDIRQAPLIAVANEAFARKFFPGHDAVGRAIKDAIGPPERQKELRTVVGVVGDALEQSPRYEAFPTLYLPLTQWPSFFPEPAQISVSVRARSGSPAALARGVAERLMTVDRNLSFTFRPLEDQIDAARHQERLIAWLSAFFGGLALVLAAVGLFGIASSTVVRRRTEIGIRMALGAQRREVVGLALGQTILATVAGIAIGLAAAAMLTRYLEAMLFGITPLDPVTFVAAPAVLVVVALVACFLPACRATSIDPMVALRCE